MTRPNIDDMKKRLEAATAYGVHRSVRFDLACTDLPECIDWIKVLEDTMRGAASLCRCRGSGQYVTDCTLCGDSTFDHECNDRKVDCKDERCLGLRAALGSATEYVSPQRRIEELEQQVAELRAALSSAYQLSKYAAASKEENTPEFMEDLFVQIESVQALCRKNGVEP